MYVYSLKLFQHLNEKIVTFNLNYFSISKKLLKKKSLKLHAITKTLLVLFFFFVILQHS